MRSKRTWHTQVQRKSGAPSRSPEPRGRRSTERDYESVGTRRRVELECFFFSSRRRHTRFDCDWSSDVCSSDLIVTHDMKVAESCARTIALRDGRVEHDERRRPYSTASDSLEPETERLRGRERPEIGRASCRERV